MTAVFDWSQIAAWRMNRHQLMQRADRSQLLEIVSQICGVHALCADLPEKVIASSGGKDFGRCTRVPDTD